MAGILWAMMMVGCIGIRSAQRDVVVRPDDDVAWVTLGDAYRRNLKPKRAREAYGRALAINPDNEDARAAMAKSAGRNPRVVRAALRNPNDDELWGDAGDYYVSVGRNEEALSAYRYAMTLDPSDSEWIGAVIRLGGSESVSEMLSDPSANLSDEALGDIGDYFMGSGERERACEMYRRALAMDPSDDEWTQRVSECEGGAISLAEPFIEDPGMSGMSSARFGSPQMLQQQVFSNEALLRELGMAHARAGDLGEAQKYLHSALLIKPNEEATLEMYCAVTGRGRLDILEQLAEEVPDNDELLGEIGDQLLSEGRPQEAQVYYKRALDIDPSDPEWTKKLQILEAASR
ncbi:MAG: tetratricopeptide repeat protein [Myxococcota bacterium]